MRKPIEVGKFMECSHCGKVHPQWANGTICFSAFLYIWERDLLYAATKESKWHWIARNLGFSDEKIAKHGPLGSWPFPDEGRCLAYMKRGSNGEFYYLWGLECFKCRSRSIRVHCEYRTDHIDLELCVCEACGADLL